MLLKQTIFHANCKCVTMLGTSGAEVAGVNTLPHKIFSSGNSVSHSGHLKWGRSKSETPTHNSQLAQEAVNIFDDKNSEQQKV